MKSHEMQKVVEKYMDAFANVNLDLIREIYASDATLEDPVGTPPRHGIESIVEFYKAAMASGMKLTLNGQPRCAGNSVAFVFTGILPGMSISPIDVFEFNAEGKIQHMRAYWGRDNIETVK